MTSWVQLFASQEVQENEHISDGLEGNIFVILECVGYSAS